MLYPKLVKKQEVDKECAMRFWVLTGVATSLVMMGANALAEPMMAPTPQEAASSPWIVEGEYLDYDKGAKVEYFGCADATYRVVKILKHPLTKDQLRDGQTIHVAYAFHDGSACLAPPAWKFSEKLMPEKSSRWILFLNKENSQGKDVFGTYRGDYGRWPLNKENETKITKLISHR